MMGERLSELVSFEGLKLAAGTVLLSPYIPLLFMGEEYGETAPFTYFVSHSDPELIQAVRQGRKQEFAAFHAEGEPLDPEALETFLQCKLHWEKRQEGHHQVLWSFYQHLIRLRQTLPPLKQKEFQSMEVACQEGDKVLWWRRWSETSQVLGVMNFNSNDVTLPLAVPGDRWHKILDSAEEKWRGPGSTLEEDLRGEQSLTVRSHSFALYEAAS